MNELEPCPFCGYPLPLIEGLISPEIDEDGALISPSGVCCSNCSAYAVGGNSYEEAIKAWNTRVTKGREMSSWTKDKPTEPGWYWTRHMGRTPTIEKIYFPSACGTPYLGGYPIRDNDEWSGPIEPPIERSA